MASAWCAAIVVACGPGLRIAGGNELAVESLRDASGDARAHEALMRENVVNGGLHFDDPACAAQFPPGEVPAAQLTAFARCLAQLELQPSPRQDPLGDVAVMTYGPGFEVEARVINEQRGPRLVWIGFASQLDRGGATPTLGRAAFEALRVTGATTVDAGLAQQLDLQLDPANGLEAVSAWLKLCLDEAGVIASLDAYEATSMAAERAFLATARGWTFRPFIHGGVARPACGLTQMTYPPSKAPTVEILPLPPPPSRGKQRPIVLSPGAFGKMIEGKRISGKRNIGPSQAIQAKMRNAKIPRLIGSFRICLDEAGHVESVLPLQTTRFAEYDRDLIAAMQQWIYAPYALDDQPVPVCTKITFIYKHR